MNKYESIIIIGQNVEEEERKNLIARFTDLINTEGKVSNVNEMGLRKLAYEIGKNTEGYYVESVENMGKKKLAYEIKKFSEATYLLFNFEAQPASIAELERVYRITDDIIKYIVVRKED